MIKKIFYPLFIFNISNSNLSNITFIKENTDLFFLEILKIFINIEDYCNFNDY